MAFVISPGSLIKLDSISPSFLNLFIGLNYTLFEVGIGLLRSWWHCYSISFAWLKPDKSEFSHFKLNKKCILHTIAFGSCSPASAGAKHGTLSRKWRCISAPVLEMVYYLVLLQLPVCNAESGTIWLTWGRRICIYFIICVFLVAAMGRRYLWGFCQSNLADSRSYAAYLNPWEKVETATLTITLLFSAFLINLSRNEESMPPQPNRSGGNLQSFGETMAALMFIVRVNMNAIHIYWKCWTWLLGIVEHEGWI